MGLFAPSLLRDRHADTLTLAYLHQQENNVPDTGIPFVDGRPAPVPHDSYYGLSSNSVTTHDDIARTLHTLFQLRRDDCGYVALRTLRVQLARRLPNFGSNLLRRRRRSMTSSSDATSPPAPVCSRTSRNSSTSPPGSTPVPSATQWFSGFEWRGRRLDLNRLVNPFDANNNWVPETPLLDPDPYEAALVEAVSLAAGHGGPCDLVYITDTMGLGKYFDLIAGARYDKFSADYKQLTVASGALLLLDHTDRLGSPHAALIFKPTPLQSYTRLRYVVSILPPRRSRSRRIQPT